MVLEVVFAVLPLPKVQYRLYATVPGACIELSKNVMGVPKQPLLKVKFVAGEPTIVKVWERELLQPYLLLTAKFTVYVPALE